MTILERLEKREKKLLSRIAYIKRLISAGHFDAAESDRLWLESFTVGKVGLDICAGDMVTGDSVGVDMAHDVLGVDYMTDGDNLSFAGPGDFDYIISNYFDAFPSGLAALNEWHRVLKVGGVAAFICCDSKKYNKPLGPMANKKRQSCYTTETIKCYMERAAFKNVQITESEQMLRVYGQK